MGVALRKAAVEPPPGGSGVARPPDRPRAVGHASVVPRVERDHIEAVAIVRVGGGHEAEIRREPVGHLGPGVAGIVASVHPAVVLLVEPGLVDR